MGGKKLLTILIVVAMSLNFTILNIISSVNASNPFNLENNEKHLILDVPYVGQDTNFYCGPATFTMALNYYGINATLNDVVYNYGVGYSLIYYTLENSRLPYSGWRVSQSSLSNEFLADIYGLTYKSWWYDQNLSDEEHWNKDWLKIKQNITNDNPLTITVDEVILATDTLGFDFLYPLQKYLPLVFYHYILVVGFDEDNQTVCYQDPIFGLFDKPKYGTYRWVDIEKFKTSIRRVKEMFWVILFENTSDTPLTTEEAFKRSHERNIERLKGNSSTYFDEKIGKEDEENLFFGINALKKLRRDLNQGINNLIKTAYRYKLNNRMGITYRLMDLLYNRYYQIFPFHPDMIFLEQNDAYIDAAIEKKYTADYLRENQDLLNDDNLSEICKHEAVLFEHEAENWTKLAEYYSEFRKKGIFMLLPRAIQLVGRMAVTLDNIIAIEEAIIAGPSEK
jgi:hypothetical protein